MALHVIDGIKKEKPNYELIYLNMFIKSLGQALTKTKDFDPIDLEIKKKIVLSGVKMINADQKGDNTYKELVERFSTIELINKTAGYLTPRQFENIFPISKTYDGDKFGIKDYFYTENYIREFGGDSVIGGKFEKFLWEYHNWDIRMYTVNFMSAISDMRKHQTGKGAFEEFCEENGLTTYSMHTGNDGKEYLTNNDTGETTRAKKPIPRYMKLVKDKKTTPSDQE